MDGHHPPGNWVKIKQLLTPSHSDNHLAGQSSRVIASASQPSPASPLQPVSDRGRTRWFRNILKTRHTRSAGQSPYPVSTTSDTNALDHLSNQPNQDPTLDTVLASDANSRAAEAELPDPKKKIEDANTAFEGIKNFSGVTRSIPSTTDYLQSTLGVVDTASAIITPLKAFNSVANVIADIHPYAKAVLSIFTRASQMIIDQEDRDNAVLDLLKKLSEVYTFMNEDRRLSEISTMQELYGKVARQTLECADFIVHYAETKSAWERLSKDVFKETSALIQSYNSVFDTLMQQFRDRAVRANVVDVHRLAEDLDFRDMPYAEGAGRETAKCCLPGTRVDILSEIKSWIDSSGNDVRPVFWLNGTAGKGKSAIAHTIADWFHERGGPCAFFCFDRTREAERRHEKIFTTIARDLGDGDPIIRRAFASAVRDSNELKHTKDLTRQWREFILGPVDAAAKVIAAPVLVIIDALDESGDERSRELILRVLAGKQGTIFPSQMQFPANIRVLITSRPLADIHNHLRGSSHVCRFSIDDPTRVSTESSERDIHHYIATLLVDVDGFHVGDFNRLAAKSDGLFEWARLACEYISSTSLANRDPQTRFEAVLAGKSEKGTRLLDEMYRHILEDAMVGDLDERQEAISVFCSVMGQIIASSEPLPCTALTAMRQYFLFNNDHYKVEWAIRPLGSLVTGTTDPQIPVRPLHASFYDFLTDELRSEEFYVNVSSAQRNLAFASLGIMKDQLRFNICSLESSYLPNSAIPDLEERIKGCISAELSYSCRLWGTHVGATSAEPLLIEEVKEFFDDERLLFWLEVVALLKIVSGAVATLSCIADWLMGHSEHTGAADAVKDTRRFLRTFAPAILHSTPHLYLSALPFAPTQSTISKKFVARFPNTPRVVAGHVIHWPSMEKTIHVDSMVFAIAISPDGRRIVCGSVGGMIHIRDMETGELSGAPLLGHTGRVWSVAVSPNGHRIVSGSGDMTIRVWDTGTGEALGIPLQGHTNEVCSVSISPNGNRIVSGSADESIRVWDMETGDAFGDPLRGHTEAVMSIVISPDGKRIVSSSLDNTIRMWDMDTGEALGVSLLGHTSCVMNIAISPNGNYIVSGSYDKTIRLWDATTGNALGVPLRGHTAMIFTVTTSPDGKSIVSGSDDTTIRVWDAQTGEALGMPLQGHTSPIRRVAISPDGHRIISCSFDNTIRVWDADTRKEFRTHIERHTDWIRSVAISPDGKFIVSGSDDNMVRVWDAYTGKALGAPLQGHTDYIISVAISPNGNLIVSGSCDKMIRVWDAITGKALGEPLQGHTEDILSIAISPDGKRIISGSADKMIRMWDVQASDALGAPLQGHTDVVCSVAISPNGNLIVSGSYDKTIRIWNALTGEALGAPFHGHTQIVTSVAISPDGNRIVSGSADRTVRVWDVKTHEALSMVLRGHTDQVSSVATSLDGNTIVSGSADKTIRAWNATTGESLSAPLQVHSDAVCSVSVSSDGKHIVSGSADMTIRVWDLAFFTQPQSFESPAIHLSSNLIHALCSPSSILQDFHTPISLVPNEEGWIVGPDGRLLVWVPPSLYPVVYMPHTLVIGAVALEVDLSDFAHGESWHRCRGHSVVSL